MAKASNGAAKKAGKKAMTKSAFVAHLAEKTALTKKQVESVLDEVVEVVKTQLGPKGAGKFVLPGLARFTLSRRKAVKGGQKKINPLNGQEYVTKDKPASNRVNIRPAKVFKEALA
jgi:nucleoid DNA-binding protein